MKLHSISYILILIGAVNWLVFGFFGWEVGQVLGGGAVAAADGIGWLPRVIYILVGLSAIVEIATHKNICKECEAKGGKPQM